MSYAPHIATWAQRGRALTSELVSGNQERRSGAACARIAKRAIGLLPAGQGPVTFRIDSAYYAVDLLDALRAEHARFSVSVPRSPAMWKALADIPDHAWVDARDMPGAQAAETTYTPGGWRGEPLRLIVRRVPFSAQKIADGSMTARRRKTIHPDQLALALDGQVASVFGYSFIPADIPAERDSGWVEHLHRHRAQIEERLKDAELGQALRHLPSGDLHANRVWLTAALLALNLTAWCCDLCPAAGAPGQAPDDAPLRHLPRQRRRLFVALAPAGRSALPESLDDHRHALAATDAHRLEAIR